MRYLPNGAWMKKADSHTIQDVGIPSLVLMERAALAAVATMETEKVDFSKTLIACGVGNNGGDGLAIARLLKEKGYQAEVVLYDQESALSKECQIQKEIAKKCGVTIVTSIPVREYTSVVDAIFGVGLNRELTDVWRERIEQLNQLSGKKIAIDIPSGVCSTTGAILGVAFEADMTITFGCQKIGCVLYPGSQYMGRTYVKDIGISPAFFEKEPSVCYTFDREDLPGLIPVRKPNSHKGSYGKVLMITGSYGMAGAAYLSAKAAYTVGAGLVQVYTATENRQIIQQLLPEAIVTCYDTYDQTQLAQLISWADVVCLGCGLGTDKVAEAIVQQTIREVTVPCVIDADGLNLLSSHKELLTEKERPIVLTPHIKEMSRLLQCTVTEIENNRFDQIREFTRRFGVVCALKDARTIVSKWDRQVFVNTAGNNAMAKAGSGDVLAGVITALLAQGMPAYEATVCGVYLHACGGDEAKATLGQYSVLAEDLITGIGTCLKHTEESYSYEAI